MAGARSSDACPFHAAVSVEKEYGEHCGQAGSKTEQSSDL